MKAISVSPEAVSISGKDYPRIRLFADSAIGRDVMPLFIPDINVKWRSRVCLAARILRLGKNISEKFASRYVDALSIVNVLYPDPLDPHGEELITSGGYAILDSAVTTGHWLDTDLQSLISDRRGAGPLGSAHQPSQAVQPQSGDTRGAGPLGSAHQPVQAEINDTVHDFTHQAHTIPRLVSLVSRLATLKTGDIIILESTAVEVPLITNSYIHCKLWGSDCLKLKVK